MGLGFDQLVWLWIGVGAVTFLVLLRVTAPYGRHASVSWGPTVDNRLAWFVMEIVVLVVFWSVIGRSPRPAARRAEGAPRTFAADH